MKKKPKEDQILMDDVVTESMVFRKVMSRLGKKGGGKNSKKQWEQRFKNLQKMSEKRWPKKEENSDEE